MSILRLLVPSIFDHADGIAWKVAEIIFYILLFVSITLYKSSIEILTLAQ